MAKQSSGPQFVDSAVPDKTQHISIQDCRTLLLFGCVDHLIHMSLRKSKNAKRERESQDSVEIFMTGLERNIKTFFTT
jgi:hypothetical protein